MTDKIKVFPVKLRAGRSEHSPEIILHADGRIQGDVVEVRRAMADMNRDGDALFSTMQAICLWLLAREFER